jgi:hypothetical protein
MEFGARLHHADDFVASHQPSGQPAEQPTEQPTTLILSERASSTYDLTPAYSACLFSNQTRRDASPPPPAHIRNMVAQKRDRAEMEAGDKPDTLKKLRNMWQFANLAQYLHMFKGALKIDDDFGIEVRSDMGCALDAQLHSKGHWLTRAQELETECLKPHPSERLADIGLALLKHISSHKGLTYISRSKHSETATDTCSPDIFDEYARRQFVAKAPSRNPFGTDELPIPFNSFDTFNKIRTLQQLSVWTLNNPNSIRERLNATEAEQLDWVSVPLLSRVRTNTSRQRLSPFGKDSQKRFIYLLDDFRLYRQENHFTFEKPPAKAKSTKRASKSTRQNKKRRVSSRAVDEDVEDNEAAEVEEKEDADNGLGGMKWECICITYEEYQNYMGLIRRSKDKDEQELYASLEEQVIPELSRVAEEQARKEARRQKELKTLQKLATAKRSSRISARQEKQKETEQVEELERKRKAELAMAKAEQKKQQHMSEVSVRNYQTLDVTDHSRRRNLLDRHENSAFASEKLPRFWKKKRFASLKRTRRSSLLGRPEDQSDTCRHR